MNTKTVQKTQAQTKPHTNTNTNTNTHTQIIPIENAPTHTFELTDGCTTQLSSGATLPSNIKSDTQLYVPAHDYWPKIPGVLFILSTFGEIRDCFSNIDIIPRDSLVGRLKKTKRQRLK